MPLDDIKLNESKRKIKELILRAKSDKKMTFTKIAKHLGVAYSTMCKWKDDKSSPQDAHVKDYLEKLEKLFENPETIVPDYLLQEDAGVLEKLGNGNRRNSSLVSIFFDLDEKPRVYTGKQGVGEITAIDGKRAIVAYPNDSARFQDADGLIYMNDAGLEPHIKAGWLIGIRKVNMMDWIPGYCYYVVYMVDTSCLSVFRRLYIEKVENVERIRLVSGNSNEYPDITLELSQILAIFETGVGVTPKTRAINWQTIFS